MPALQRRVWKRNLVWGGRWSRKLKLGPVPPTGMGEHLVTARQPELQDLLTGQSCLSFSLQHLKYHQLLTQTYVSGPVPADSPHASYVFFLSFEYVSPVLSSLKDLCLLEISTPFLTSALHSHTYTCLLQQLHVSAAKLWETTFRAAAFMASSFVFN